MSHQVLIVWYFSEQQRKAREEAARLKKEKDDADRAKKLADDEARRKAEKDVLEKKRLDEESRKKTELDAKQKQNEKKAPLKVSFGIYKKVPHFFLFGPYLWKKYRDLKNTFIFYRLNNKNLQINFWNCGNFDKKAGDKKQ